METPDPFDLNQAIQNWRSQLESSPAFRGRDLEELESHLRDSTARLQKIGLSAEEALWVAQRRLGGVDRLQGEFEKVNRNQVWLNRALWIALSLPVMGFVSASSRILADLSVAAARWCEAPVGLIGPTSVFISILVYSGLFWMIWRTVRRDRGLASRAVGWVQVHPLASAVAAFLIMALAYTLQTASTLLIVRYLPLELYAGASKWYFTGQTIWHLVFWSAVLGWLLWQNGKSRTARA